MYCRYPKPTATVPNPIYAAYLSPLPRVFKYFCIQLYKIDLNYSYSAHSLLIINLTQYLNRSIIIKFMSEFYNRYRGLFDSASTRPHKQTFLNRKQLFRGTDRYGPPQPTYTPSLHGHKQSSILNLDRSPALEEFQRNVLPKLSKRRPNEDLYRLKTQMQENTSKMEQSLVRSNSPQMNFYFLPKIYAPTHQETKRERLFTEGSAPQKTRGKFKEVKNISKNIEQLEKQYFRHLPQKDSDIFQNQEQHPSHQLDSRSRITTEQKKGSRITQNMKNIVQKWETKVLNEPAKHKSFEQVKLSPKEYKDNKQYKEYQKRQDELFGVRENPFAFVNSRLQEIKRSEKYYPRGYINSYRDALFRRRRQKNNIQQRRQQLITLLSEDHLKYGVI